MQTMETTTRELSISTMVGLTLQSLHSKHPLRYSSTCSQACFYYLPYLKPNGKTCDVQCCFRVDILRNGTLAFYELGL